MGRGEVWGGSSAESGRGEMRKERGKEKEDEGNRERPYLLLHTRRKLLRAQNSKYNVVVYNVHPFPNPTFQYRQTRKQVGKHTSLSGIFSRSNVCLRSAHDRLAYSCTCSRVVNKHGSTFEGGRGVGGGGREEKRG